MQTTLPRRSWMGCSRKLPRSGKQVFAASTATSPIRAPRAGPIRYRNTPSSLNSSSPTPPGKNASDITLVIDAMDLLHSGRFDGFCLVSSDSDFTRLAARIREQGVDVFRLWGAEDTGELQVRPAEDLCITENLLSTRPAVRMPPQPQSRFSPPAPPCPSSTKPSDRWKVKMAGCLLGEVGKQLANLASDFDPRTFGFRKLSDLVRKTNSFEIDDPKGSSMRIRTKPAAGSPPK